MKCGPSGAIVKYNARLVAKGLAKHQVETTTRHIHRPHASQLSRILLNYAHRNGSELKQMDIKTAYLSDDIDEKIFMQQPEGFENYNEQENPLVCKPHKILCGLKQSGRNWYLTIIKFSLGFWFCSIFSRWVPLYKKGQRRYIGNDLPLGRWYGYNRNATKL